MAAGPGPWLLGLGLALGPAGVWAQLRLVEAGGGQRAPGDSVLLSCRGHGFDFGVYNMWWYRQAPGGRLEWVSLIQRNSSVIRYGRAVDGRATVSRDDSRSEISLSLSALSPQDSARYFCAAPTETGIASEIIAGQGLVVRAGALWASRGHPAPVLRAGPWPLSRPCCAAAVRVLGGAFGVWAQWTLLEAGGGQRAPGDSVLLSCRGHGFDFGTSYMWWYRQAPGGRLEWVSLIYRDSAVIRYGRAVDGRATVSRDDSRCETVTRARDNLPALGPSPVSQQHQPAVQLQWKVGVALQHISFCPAEVLLPIIATRVSSVLTNKLVFGSGTTLTVEPSNRNHSEPQVVVMKSKQLEGDGNSGKAACLARKFYTKNVTLEVSSSEVIYQPTTPILSPEGLYDTVKVVNVTKGTEVSCTAKYDGRDVTANETPPEKEAGESAPEDVCHTTDTSAQDAEGEKTNMLSVAVLGLRVLLAKSIALSALMSIKLLLF
ncbi:uncharacterized protein LOC133629461 [Colius striatus]|uniref:uncharacterized protein LOC133629461 n=1 Tax=Colius striatus TaxID=57412 RepID=UPI002B1D6EFC|nr:uncharacterized protein LOC133629461 [Colius striatus]